MSKDEIWINKLLEPAGLTVNGKNPWDIQILNNNFYSRLKAGGSLAFGESYMDGWWTCEQMDVFFYKLLLAKIPDKIGLSLPLIFTVLSAKLFNLQSKNRAFQVGEKHYDTGNELFVEMLGKTMAYSCGYWKNATDLDSAQSAKFDLICRKLNLQPGQKILDIGCGWGGFLKYASEHYKISGVGLTVSKEQAEFARNACKNLPIEIRVQDYRELRSETKFDHVVSVGMFEHVGVKNYRTFFEVAKKLLKPDGLFLLHTIGKDVSQNNMDPWFDKYIFPNGILPSVKQVSSAVEKLFVIEDYHNFGADYDPTLLAWHKNFIASWPKLKTDYKDKYDERFYKMWNYYLLSCAGAFRARQNQLFQFVLSPSGVLGGYESVR